MKVTGQDRRVEPQGPHALPPQSAARQVDLGQREGRPTRQARSACWVEDGALGRILSSLCLQPTADSARPVTVHQTLLTPPSFTGGAQV